VPRYCRARGIDAELMPPGLAGKQAVEGIGARSGPVFAQQFPQLNFLVVAEAAEHGAGRGDPDTVATLAEIVGQRRDQPQADAEAVDLLVTRGPAGARE
jgi:hypothetical protein